MDRPRLPLSAAIDQFIDGDGRTGDAICEGLEPSIRAVVHRVLTPGDPDADDVVQDTIMAVLRYLRDTAVAPNNIEAFASTIARNRCINLLVWRRRRLASDVDRFSDTIPDVGASPLELIEERSANQLLGRVLGELDDACRKLLQSIYQAEVPIEELRRALGLKSVQAVYYRKDVCIRKAQTILNQLLLSSRRDERGPTPDRQTGAQE